ncbi:MAG TPA: alkaline phosphatase [Burkholderiales bacterium]|nr:alkaline phosphatase [Burkholderiales bacterium]
MTVRRPFALLFGFLVASLGADMAASAESAAGPKNIIILFADGVAATQWELGRYSARVLRNQSFAATDVVFRDGVLGLLSTDSRDAFVTDSAAAASAMSTGVKVDNFAVSMTPDGKAHRTIMEAAKSAGKKIGLVTTAEIYDASPAAFSVHAKNRREAQSIVDQYLAMEPDVLLGGGRDYFLAKSAPGGKRGDGKDMIAAFAQKGYQIVRDTRELKNAKGAKLLGLFADEDMAFEIDRDAAKEPSMTEMARAALDALSTTSPNGFVLFVENENTDTAGHYNDAAGVMRALWAFDETLKIALDFRSKAPNQTLIIVTGDHETGGLSATYALRTPASDVRLYAGIANLQMLERITISFGAAAKALGRKPSPEALDKLIAQHFPGLQLDADLREAILNQSPLDRNFSYATQNALGRMVARQTGFYWGTSGHTTEPVAVGAIGPGAELFKGYQDNTDFARNLHRLIGGR